jgi:hypothetical protein
MFLVDQICGKGGQSHIFRCSKGGCLGDLIKLFLFEFLSKKFITTDSCIINTFHTQIEMHVI